MRIDWNQFGLTDLLGTSFFFHDEISAWTSAFNVKGSLVQATNRVADVLSCR